VQLTDLHLRAARGRIAALDASTSVAPVLGSIRLRDHQRDSVRRVLTALERDGGCLLADDVGMGKTYVALAVARTWARPLIVVPASLRSTWIDAMARAGRQFDITSHEALSRGRLPGESHDGIIVDESHRFRSTTARRHAALAEISAHARLLLLSATPLQNRTRDLAAQVALFHGARAFRLEPHALARFVVRGPTEMNAALPAVAPPKFVRPAADDAEVLREILALPAPTAPVDGGDAGILRTIGLVRAWGSSRAALADMLRRRRQVAAAIEQCVADGLLPTKH
jgi:SNF2-related domain